MSSSATSLAVLSPPRTTSPTPPFPRPKSEEDARPAPDGGLRAWLVVLGAWCCLFASFGWITCMGLFQDYYASHQLSRYPSSTVAWIPSTETFVVFFGAPFAGRVFDGWGARGLLVFGTLMHGFGLMMASVSHEYYQLFLAQAVCSALGACALFWGANNSVGTWFEGRRALAMGVASSGSGLGGVVGSAAIPPLFGSIGFGWTMRAVAFVYLAMGCVAILTVKSRLDHRTSPFHPLDFVRPLWEPAVLLTAVASFFFFLGVFLPYNYLITAAMYYGMSRRLAEYSLTILSATSVFGRIIPGWLGDKYGRFNIQIATTFLSAILVLALWIPANSNAPNLVFAGLYGVSSGTFVAMVPALIAQVCPDMKRLGVYMGACYIVICPAVLIGQPIAGALIDSDGGDYTNLQIFCGLVMFVGGLLYIAARGVHGGFGLKKL